MNLLSYLEPIKSELNLILQEEEYGSIDEDLEEMGEVDLSNKEKISYYLGQINLIGLILQNLAVENPEWTKGDEEE